MKKQTKIKGIPLMYSQILPHTSGKDLRLVIVQDKNDHRWIKYKEGAPISLMNNARLREFHGYESFEDGMLELDLEEVHSELFGRVPSKSLDRATLALYCWGKIISVAKDRTDLEPTVGTKKVDSRNGPRASLLERKYYLQHSEAPKGIKIPPQALVCFNILRDIVDGDHANEQVEADGSVTEQELRAAVMKAAEEGKLKTKQDPWRIFQYYRANLVSCGMIKHD